MIRLLSANGTWYASFSHKVQYFLTCFTQVNQLERGHDTNVSGVWLEGVNGSGVTVAVVDDGQLATTNHF